MSAQETFRRAGPARLPVLTFPVFDGLPVEVVVTTRDGGVSEGPYTSLNLGLHVGDDPEAVRRNRERAATAVGLTLEDLVFCNQTHGAEVAVVGADDRGRGSTSPEDAVPDTDAVVTTTPDVGLVMMMADCVPVVLFDPGSAVLACVHAGWRGTVARVVDAAVEAMLGLGARRTGILAAVGPSIPGPHYQVGPEVAEAVTDCFGPSAGELLRPDDEGRWRLDLAAATCRALADAGVEPARVDATTLDTRDERFFSDRLARPCGRFAAIARLHP